MKKSTRTALLVGLSPIAVLLAGFIILYIYFVIDTEVLGHYSENSGGQTQQSTDTSTPSPTPYTPSQSSPSSSGSGGSSGSGSSSGTSQLQPIPQYTLPQQPDVQYNVNPDPFPAPNLGEPQCDRIGNTGNLYTCGY